MSKRREELYGTSRVEERYPLVQGSNIYMPSIKVEATKIKGVSQLFDGGPFKVPYNISKDLKRLFWGRNEERYSKICKRMSGVPNK